MKTLIILTSILFSLNLFAGQIVLKSPCDNTIKTMTFDETIQNETVGSISVKLFELNKVPFLGTDGGMNSILNTPTGLDAMDVTSDNEMFAYGWCYSLNGYEPESYPDKVFVNTDDNIVWWYGFAHYLDGEWISQCEPSSKRRNSILCSN